MSGLVALFYSDLTTDFQVPSGLATLARYPQVVLNAEMATATADSQGRPYASDGMTPAGWLAAEDVDVWSYVNPFWVQDAKTYGGPGEQWRRSQSQAVELMDAWLRKALNGERVAVYGGQRWAVDIRNLQYRAWLERNAPGKRLFVDCGFYYAGAYHGWVGGPDVDRANIIKALYSRWREQGVRLVVNAGWEALDLDAAKRTYPFVTVVDGVAIEVPGGQSGPQGYRDLVSYRKGRPDLNGLRRVVGDWLEMGREVWLVAKWQRSKPADYTYSPWPTFEEHADFWLTAAQEMGCSVSVFWNNNQAPWEEHWVAEWGNKPENGEQSTEARLADLERRVRKLEAAMR